MNDIQNHTIVCPHCGHHLHIELDITQGDQDYYESCSNCCNDIHLNMHIDELRKKVQLSVDADDEQVF